MVKLTDDGLVMTLDSDDEVSYQMEMEGHCRSRP